MYSERGCHKTDDPWYDYRKSKVCQTNEKDKQEIDYGSGSMLGFWAKDLFQIKDTYINVMHSMLFAYEDSGMEGMASDGILGLSND